jgi:Protein of unknown function (DUF2934)
MDGQLEHRTRQRAFEIWEREGAGDPVAHWLQAERELARESQERRSSTESLPEHWQAAIEATLQKMRRRAQRRANRLRERRDVEVRAAARA